MNAGYDQSAILYQEGRAEMQSGNLDSAVEKLKKSAELAPHFKTLECLGECYLEQKNYYQAIIFLASAAGMGNNQSRPYFLLAKALLAIGEKDKAIEKLERALQINSDYKTARDLLTEIS